MILLINPSQLLKGQMEDHITTNPLLPSGNKDPAQLKVQMMILITQTHINNPFSQVIKTPPN